MPGYDYRDDEDVIRVKDEKGTWPGVTRNGPYNNEIIEGDVDAAMANPEPFAHPGAVGPGRPTELCVVTPSYRRAWDRAPFTPLKAGSAFIGPFSRKCQTYAEMFYPGSWCVLDARHGFMFPHEVIRQKHSACLFRPWTQPVSIVTLASQIRRRGLDRYQRIVVLGGRRFICMVEDAFGGRKVRAPLAGVGGIGDMMHEMNVALDTGLPL